MPNPPKRLRPQSRPGIPAISTNLPPELQGVLQAMKENIEIGNGTRTPGRQVGGGGKIPGSQGSGQNSEGWKRRGLTLGMAVKAGLIDESKALELYKEP